MRLESGVNLPFTSSNGDSHGLYMDKPRLLSCPEFIRHLRIFFSFDGMDVLNGLTCNLAALISHCWYSYLHWYKVGVKHCHVNLVAFHVSWQSWVAVGSDGWAAVHKTGAN